MGLPFPYMRRSDHVRMIEELQARCDRDLADMADVHQRYLAMLKDQYQAKVDAEYARARAEGIAQIHAWAVAVNYSIFQGQGDFSTRQRTWVRAALQDAEHQFKPSRTQLEAPLAITQGEQTCP